MGRVCAVGIDAASIDLIEQLCDAGALPHMEALRRRSARTRLDSAPTHRNGMLWTQFVSGRDISHDDARFRCRFDPDTYEAYETSARHIDEAGAVPFWEGVDGSVITFDVPRSTISGPGVHVTAWGAHAPSYPRASSPRGLLREIDERFGPHPAFDNEYACGWHDPTRLDRLTAALETGARRSGEIATFLMDRFPDWQLFVGVLSESHSASEFMWHGIDRDHPLTAHVADVTPRVERVFRAMDDAIGTIVRALRPDDTFFLFSLDGMMSSHGDLPSIVLLPELLHRHRFGMPLVRDPDQDAWRAAGYPPVIPPRHSVWRNEMDRRLVAPPTRSIRARIQRLPVYDAARTTEIGRWLLARVKHTRIGALGVPIPPECDDPPEVIERARERADEMLFLGHYQRFWRAMPTFALPTFGDAYLRVNVIGREQHGQVSPADYDDARRTVDALVSECRDPRTGRLVTDGVEWLDAPGAGPDPLRPYADGIVRWTHPTDAFEHPELGTIGPFPLHRTGVHTGTGFVWAAGPDIAAAQHPDRSVLDLPATILQATGPRATKPPSGTAIPLLTRVHVD